MAPSEMVAWECSACTFTNEDVQRRGCQLCMTERPVRYAIVAGAAGAVLLAEQTAAQVAPLRASSASGVGSGGPAAGFQGVGTGGAGRPWSRQGGRIGRRRRR